MIKCPYCSGLIDADGLEMPTVELVSNGYAHVARIMLGLLSLNIVLTIILLTRTVFEVV